MRSPYAGLPNGWRERQRLRSNPILWVASIIIPGNSSLWVNCQPPITSYHYQLHPQRQGKEAHNLKSGQNLPRRSVICVRVGHCRSKVDYTPLMSQIAQKTAFSLCFLLFYIGKGGIKRVCFYPDLFPIVLDHEIWQECFSTCLEPTQKVSSGCLFMRIKVTR